MRKLTSLRPCDWCGGKVSPTFQVITVSQALINANAVNKQLGMGMVMGNLTLAEVFSSQEEAFVVFGDKDKDLAYEFFICETCFSYNKFNLVEMIERIEYEKASSDSIDP